MFRIERLFFIAQKTQQFSLLYSSKWIFLLKIDINTPTQINFIYRKS